MLTAHKYVGRSDVRKALLWQPYCDFAPADSGIKATSDDAFIEIDGCGGCRLNETGVSLANYRTLLKRIPLLNKDGVVQSIRAHGDYGTYALMINMTTIDQESSDEVIKILYQLDDYPILDDDELELVRGEIREEQYDSWIGYEFYSEAGERYPMFDFDLEPEGLREAFRVLFDEYGHEEIFESGGLYLIPSPADLVRTVPFERLEEVVNDARVN